MRLPIYYKNWAVRILAVLIFAPLAMDCLADVAGGWEDQPYSRITGAVGLVCVAFLFTIILRAIRNSANSPRP
jgi:hypothetical protein